MFHATRVAFDKFKRPPQGIYVTRNRENNPTLFGNVVIPVYADIRKFYLDTDHEFLELAANRKFNEVAVVIKALAAQGYDACSYGIPPDTIYSPIVLFGKIKIANALTGKPM